MASCALRHAHSDAIHSVSHALTQFPAAFAFIRRNRRSTASKEKSSMDDFQDPPATDFSSILSPRRQLRQFHRPPPDSFAGIPNILQRNGFVDRESNSIRASRKIVCGYPVLSATVTAESAEIPKFSRISAAAARRRRVKL